MAVVFRTRLLRALQRASEIQVHLRHEEGSHVMMLVRKFSSHWVVGVSHPHRSAITLSLDASDGKPVTLSTENVEIEVNEVGEAIVALTRDGVTKDYYVGFSVLQSHSLTEESLAELDA